MELFNTMREQSNRTANQPGTRSLSNASSLTTLCPDISPSSSHFFEVLYIGKIKVSHKKVPDSFIDDALDKFHKFEQEKREKEALINNNENGVVEPILTKQPFQPNSSTGTYGSTETLKSDTVNENVPQVRMRKRSGSAGSVLIKKPENLSVAAAASLQEHNRTMVFHVGRTDIRLISPDRKQVLLHKLLKDITFSIQGTKHACHFAFICRENITEPPSFIGYVFKCQSPSVAEDVVTAISQALSSEACRKPTTPPVTIVSCDHCPMVWYHKLCSEIEGLSERASQVTILRKLELLPEEEQTIVQTKLQGALDSSNSPKEQIELLMMILRAHCESKQSRHVHDTPENRHEFLNHYLGGGTIFMKAKRSLTNSFDQLLKRKGSKDDFGPMMKEFSLPANTLLCKDSPSGSISDGRSTPPEEEGQSQEEKAGSMLNIFLKVGNSPAKAQDDEGDDKNLNPASWRQAIFNTVVTPSKTLPEPKVVKRDKEFYRALWKKAINQQVLLIRMEKENARLTARQEQTNVKRIKLEYDDLGLREISEVWDSIMNKERATQDTKILLQALKQGVPKSKRGDVWMYMADNFRVRNLPFDSTNFPNYDVSYGSLLKQLTSHQHAILIDLGRTFPQHVYYSSPLGPGQLALFNILKAYSLLDPEVGYCQGLSFIAAVLLLHVTEEQAFLLLKHLMFRRGLRARYLPDMAALQVNLYQLSRLLHDHYPGLYAHLDKYEVSPTLYAAPWLLTIFASQFPLGFVTRVFDVIFADSTDVLFRVAITLLGHHIDGIMACDSFEMIMDYLKNKLPDIDSVTMDKIMKEVLHKDICRELNEYGVEYHVLQEEISTPRPETKKIKQLEVQNKTLTAQNKAMSEQLQIATSNINRLESSRATHMSQINRLESQVRSLEVTVTALGEFITTLAYNKSDLEIPTEILRILTQFNISETRKRNSNSGEKLLRGSPLKVIDDNKGHHPPLKMALSSPNLTTKVTNFFNHATHKLAPVEDKHPHEPQIKKSFSDTREVKLDTQDLIKTKSSERLDVSKFGRILTPEDRKALRLDEEKEGKSILKSSQSTFELKTQPSNNSLLPLDSDCVSVSFEGTTKLRSIRPARTRNSSNSLSPSASTVSVPPANEALKIIEQKEEDAISDKLRVTMDKVSHLFDSPIQPDSHSNDYEKPLGKETELLIKSQAPSNKTGLLT